VTITLAVLRLNESQKRFGICVKGIFGVIVWGDFISIFNKLIINGLAMDKNEPISFKVFVF
jgi:hypothetical protein